MIRPTGSQQLRHSELLSTHTYDTLSKAHIIHGLTTIVGRVNNCPMSQQAASDLQKRVEEILNASEQALTSVRTFTYLDSLND